MDGITVLYQNFPHIDFVVLIGSIIICIIGIATFIASIIWFKEAKENMAIATIIISGFFIVLSIWSICNCKTDYKEKILIDDTVPYTYIEENYDIIHQEGKIYEVIPKCGEPSKVDFD